MAEMIEQSMLRGQIIMGCEGEDVAMSCLLTLYVFATTKPQYRNRDKKIKTTRKTERKRERYDNNTEGYIYIYI